MSRWQRLRRAYRRAPKGQRIAAWLKLRNHVADMMRAK